jgi:hypothetical protein
MDSYADHPRYAAGVRFWQQWRAAQEAGAPVELWVEGEPHTIRTKKTEAGDSKAIYSLGAEHVLMLPSSEAKHLLSSRLQEWESTITREVMGNRKLRARGLLAPELYPVQVRLGDGEISALVSRSFRSLLKNGVEVRDRNHPGSRYGETMLFGTYKNLRDPEYHLKLYAPLIDDIAQLFLSNVAFDADSFNLAIQHPQPINLVQKPSEEPQIISAESQLRLFPYDVQESNKPIYHLAGKNEKEQREYIRSRFTAQAFQYLDFGLDAMMTMEEKQCIARDAKKPSYDILSDLWTTLRSPEVKDVFMERVESRIMDKLAEMHPALRKRLFTVPEQVASEQRRF